MQDQLEQTMMIESNDSMTFQNTVDFLSNCGQRDHAENITAHFNAVVQARDDA